MTTYTVTVTRNGQKYSAVLDEPNARLAVAEAVRMGYEVRLTKHEEK